MAPLPRIRSATRSRAPTVGIPGVHLQDGGTGCCTIAQVMLSGEEVPQFHVFSEPSGLVDGLARALTEAVSARGRRRFSLALTGGRSAQALYARLASTGDPDLWAHTSFLLSDERLVPYDDPESNARAALDDWLTPLGLADDVVVRPDLGVGEPSDIAYQYEQHVRRVLGPELAIDCVLLSLGEDGHIASLFPGHPAVTDTERLVAAVVDCPKPPARRITMTLPLLNRARRVHLMVAGDAKADAFKAMQEAPADPLRRPAQGLDPLAGRLAGWVDVAATQRLEFGRWPR
jgi:6-phosphogluconolactonase